MDDLHEFDVLLDYLGGGSDQSRLNQQRLDQPSVSLDDVGMQLPGMLPGPLTGTLSVSMTGMQSSIPSLQGTGDLLPAMQNVTCTNASNMPGLTPPSLVKTAPVMTSAFLPGGVSALQPPQHGQPQQLLQLPLRMQLPPNHSGLLGVMPGLGGLLGMQLGNVDALGALAGMGSLRHLDVLLGVQSSPQMAPGHGGVLPRETITTAAAAGSLGTGTLGAYAAAFGGGGGALAGSLGATTATAPAPSTTAKGAGSGGGRRGRSGQRLPSRRVDVDLGSSDGDLDSNSDSASSDGDALLQKSHKKKREGGGGQVEEEADRRHAALQEKNRKAQRRFRERQKVT